MKNILLPVLLTFFTGYCFAQRVVERKNKLTSTITEQFQSVIEDNKQVKQGIYQVFFAKTTLLASGVYKDDKRIGIWRFFDLDGKKMQTYDYDKKQILFEDHEGSYTRFSYKIDYPVTAKDSTTKPVKLGGRYFGYLPYLRLFKLPADLVEMDYEQCAVILELLVSPMGRLADFNMRIINSYTGQDIRVYNVNTDLISADDKIFIPATYNKINVSCTIKIACFMNKNGDIDIDRP